MPRNKYDRRKISKEKHEVAYCRKIAKQVLKHIEGVYTSSWISHVSPTKVKRLARAYLKLSRKRR